MQTVNKPYSAEYRVKGSRFSGYLYPAEDLDAVNSRLKDLKSEHPTATHHCYAYRLDPNKFIEFNQDDGEPGNTAGLPILNSLRSNELINVLLVVVRYFGGTKLGKSGLIEAYGHTADLCIQKASLKKVLLIKTYCLVFDYSLQGFIDKLKNDFTWIELKSEYMENVKLIVGCPADESERFEGVISSQIHHFQTYKPLCESFHVIK